MEFNDYLNILNKSKPKEECCHCQKEPTIIKGSTNVHSFTLPYTSIDIESVLVSYKQDGEIILRKYFEYSNDELSLEDTEDNFVIISYKISENESYLFKDDSYVDVQLKLVLSPSSESESEVVTSEIYKCKVIPVLDDTRLLDTDFEYAFRVDIDDQDVSIFNYVNLVSNNIYKCLFNFDNIKDISYVAVFKDEYGHFSEINIANNECVIPSEILENPGLIYVGVKYEVSSEDYEPTIWSSGIRVDKSCINIIDDVYNRSITQEAN